MSDPRSTEAIAQALDAERAGWEGRVWGDQGLRLHAGQMVDLAREAAARLRQLEHDRALGDWCAGCGTKMQGEPMFCRQSPEDIEPEPTDV